MERQAWKLIVLLLLFCYVHSPYVKAQVGNGKQITMEFKNEGLPSIFKRLQKLSGYKVLFIYDEVRSYHSTGKVEKASIEEVLKVIIGKHPLKYVIEGQFINITHKNPQNVISEVKGKIIAEEDGLPVIGATIQVEGTSIRTITDANGNFRLINVPQSNRIKISYVGMQSQSLSPKPQMSVVLKTDTKALDEVVVEAGIIQRNKMGFTGSYRTVNQEELKAVGNINVLQSLKTLDPSFVVADDMSMGSDPNTMSRITMRGGTTMTISGIYDDTTTNPNEPLFILDGFESSLQEINDLDINRIESITLLKDAASTAIYGSKGANGVVVVETIKPKAGEVMINYSGDAQVAWADLSVYNMMNAAEKLEFEVLAGRYGDLNDWSGNRESIAQYQRALENVRRGVDTYWLKVPIQTAVTQSHSLNVSGGDKGFLYQIGAMFKDIQGVMKGSVRQTFGGNSVSYSQNGTYISNKFNISANSNLPALVDFQPLIRVTEMYYIQAEAALKDGDKKTAAELLNTVSSHRGIPETSFYYLTENDMDEQFYSHIESEYYKEFYGEGQVYFYHKRMKSDQMFPGYGGTSVAVNASAMYNIPIPNIETDI